MKTIQIRTPEERLAARQQGERRARVTLVQLLCIVSILRTAMTRVLPLAGSSLWWVTLLCLLPGLVLFGLTYLALGRTNTSTLGELARRRLGKGGAWIISIALGALLLTDALTSLTALITLFTEGIGTRGTQFTLALLTGAVLLLSLHREGLPRGVYLLRWGMLAAALAAAAFFVPAVKMDALFPLQGGGLSAVLAAARAGMGLSWPLLLLLTIPAGKKRPPVADAAPVVLTVLAVLLLICLTVPHEVIIRQQTLADCLLLPARFVSSAVRTLVHCLMMLAFFLAIGGAVQLGTDSLCAPVRQSPGWLPYAVLMLLVLSQALSPLRLWVALNFVGRWLPLTLVGIIGLCLIRMNSGRDAR